MDVDKQGQQRTNVSVKSKCYRTAQRELIRGGHTLCSQVLSLTAAQKEKFPPPLNYFVFLFLYPYESGISQPANNTF
jgi:hypothetical protein